MALKTLNDLSELTKEGIADLYFQSLGNAIARKNHVQLLGPTRISGTPAPVSVHDIEMDFKAWYGGVLSLAQTIDAGVELPTTPEMVGFITPNFERARAAIAA